MDEHLSVGVPRNLRVGTTVAMTIADTTIRLRLPVFLCLSGAGISAVVALLAGRFNLVALLIVLGAIGAAALEVRLWGYGTGAFGRIILGYLRQPMYLDLEPIEIILPAEAPASVMPRRPRWDLQRSDGEQGAAV